MEPAATPVEKIYVIANQRDGAEHSLDLLIDLNLDPLQTFWESDGRLWVAFADVRDAVLFRLRFPGWSIEECDWSEIGAEAVFIVSPGLRDAIADWVKENSAEDRVMWAERVRLRFSDARSQREFEHALSPTMVAGEGGSLFSLTNENPLKA